ncbi:LCP family protein [Thermocrispum municipale]|uniref:LCP family protein n=1 Tax=Thermocrispum municipale TaxID=37926 RepID=UPI000403142E|nr:LCP family protein [Thermocrispum municipale]
MHARPPRQAQARPEPPERLDRPPRRRRRRFGPGKILLTLVLLFVVFLAAVWIYLDVNMRRVDAIGDYPGRPAAGEGTNWLIVGSDNRNGLSEEEIKRLHVGKPNTNATDTILLAHLPDNGTKPTLVSFPRDLIVTTPDYPNGVQINSVYARGKGPKQLVKTIEQVTNLRIDHYAEIGLGGFATMVDAIGGVEMTIPKDMVDGSNGQKLKAGTYKLNGAQALTFVRMRKGEATPRSDLDRVANQRKFIGALAGEIASPATLLNPFDLFPLLGEIPDALSIDEEDHLHHLFWLAWAARGISDGGMVNTTVPVTGCDAKSTDEEKAKQMFDALRNDQELPDSVINATDSNCG